MKVAAIHGSERRGSTWNITRLFLDALEAKGAKVAEFYLPKDMPSFCLGCFGCINHGEDRCPHYEYMQPIVSALDEADLLILTSPVYVMSASGQMKAFLDHTAYRFMIHRPEPSMFHKTGLVISTGAGGGMKSAHKVMRECLFNWGVPKVYSYGKAVFAASWEGVSDKIKKQIERDVEHLSARIQRKLGREKPGIKTKAWFMLMHMMHKRMDMSPLDKSYWNRHGWLEKSRPWHALR